MQVPVATDSDAIMVVILVLAAALLFPNSNEIVPGGHLTQCHLLRSEWQEVAPGAEWMVWQPSVAVAAGIGVIFILVLASLSKPSPFLYFQF